MEMLEKKMEEMNMRKGPESFIKRLRGFKPWRSDLIDWRIAHGGNCWSAFSKCNIGDGKRSAPVEHRGG